MKQGKKTRQQEKREHKEGKDEKREDMRNSNKQKE